MSALRNIEAEEAEGEADEFRGTAWAVNLADLMTFLMIFFLIMFSMYVSAQSGGQSKADVEAVIKSIEDTFRGRTKPHMIAVPMKKPKLSIAEQEKLPTTVKKLTAVASIQLGRTITYPYQEKISRKEMQKINQLAAQAIAKSSGSYNGYFPSVQIASDEVATFVISEVIYPVKIVLKKIVKFADGYYYYTTQRGDTIAGICAKLGIDPKKAKLFIPRTYLSTYGSGRLLPGKRIKIKMMQNGVVW